MTKVEIETRKKLTLFLPAPQKKQNETHKKGGISVKSVKLKVEVTLAGEIAKPCEVIVLSDLSAQALVNEGKAVFVEEN